MSVVRSTHSLLRRNDATLELVFFLPQAVYFFDQRLVLLIETFPCPILPGFKLSKNLILEDAELFHLGLTDAFRRRPFLLILGQSLSHVLGTWVGLDSPANSGKRFFPGSNSYPVRLSLLFLLRQSISVTLPFAACGASTLT